MRLLYLTPFVWTVPHDDNRLADGRDLRKEFIHEVIHDQGELEVDPDWIYIGCSVLELIVGLSRRLAFEAEGEAHYWFWVMLGNLDLSQYNDQRDISPCDVEEVLNRLIFRQYEPSGEGGLFPLKHPQEDQRRVELWYQLSAYVLEL